MASKLSRLGAALATHWKTVAVFILIGIIGLGVIAKLAPPAPADNFTVPGSESQKAMDLFETHDKQLAGIGASVVYKADSKTNLLDPKVVAQVKAAVKRIENIDGVISVADPYQFKMISADKKIALVNVTYDINPTEIKQQDETNLVDAGTIKDNQVETAFGGPLIDAASGQEAPTGEIIGIVMAMILLTVLFRSKVAMGITLAGAVVGVIIGQLLLTILSGPLGLPDFAKTIAIMLGLGAGVDYSLLIVGRYREQISAGDNPKEALSKSLSTSGVSVLTAGLIVMFAISGLLVIGIPLIGKMGLGAGIGVAAVVVSALVVLPVGIGALSKRLAPKNSRSTDPSPLLTRWGKHIVRRPVLTIVSGVAIMLVFAVPVSSMYLGQPDDGNQPKSETQRVAYDWTTEAFGAGFNGPFLIAIQVPENPTVKTKTDVLKLIKDLKATPDVASVAPPIVSKDKKLVTLTLIPKTSPQSQKTSDLLEQIRNQTIPDSVGNDLNVYVGGQTATLEDFSDKVTDRLPLFIAVVIGFSVLLLMAAFRSVWIPLASAAFNLLSVAAAFGIISAVFQDGIGASLIGAESGVPIISFIPVMIFAILFGLSMDYNVFLLSRIHESYNNSGDVDQSVVDGVGRIGKVIMFAGLIMASVFLAFVTQSNIAAKMMGLGLGAAILVDVFFVRLMIAPALVKLLGDRAWWFPGWLDRILPSISLEGEANQRDWINHKK